MEIADRILPALHSECVFTYAYAKNPHEFSKATTSSWNGNGSSCCPRLQINVCVCVYVHVWLCGVLKGHIYLSNTCDPLSNTPHFLYAHKDSLK